MSTIFKKIIDGQIPGYIIFEDKNFLAFLDINPVVYGHTLLIPKIEVDYFFDIDNTLLKDLIIVAKNLSSALQKATNCKRVALRVYGFDIPHAHVHLLPANDNNDLSANSKLHLSNSEFQALAAKIKTFL
ncbi:MAG: HIT family protein [Solitalea-like symbiont of Acarus siro]